MNSFSSLRYKLTDESTIAYPENRSYFNISKDDFQKLSNVLRNMKVLYLCSYVNAGQYPYRRLHNLDVVLQIDFSKYHGENI